MSGLAAAAGTLAKPGVDLSKQFFEKLGISESEKSRIARSSDLERTLSQNFNDEIFRLAESFIGKVGSNPLIDFEKLQFSGADPRQERLQRLVSAFTTRRQEIQQKEFQPGLSQTRLSLVE